MSLYFLPQSVPTRHLRGTLGSKGFFGISVPTQDVARAIKAAKGSGLDIVRVEVDPKTAKITLVVKNDDNTESKINPFDSAPVPEPTRGRRKTKPCV
jgi:hypothetical protein